MAEVQQIRVPDIGGATGVDVIEILVKPGDIIAIDTPIVTLETDKASMEVPSPAAGKVQSVSVKVGDKVSEGDLLLVIEAEGAVSIPEPAKPAPAAPAAPEPAVQPPKTSPEGALFEVTIPDIGGAVDVDVIEVMVRPGDTVAKDTSLLTLEGDKATMEIPSPHAGVVETVHVSVGDKVSEGSAVLVLKIAEEDSGAVEPPKRAAAAPAPEAPVTRTEPVAAPMPPVTGETSGQNGALVAAGPAVRRLARELGVTLSEVRGSGRKGRIQLDDLRAYVKMRLAEPRNRGGFALPEAPVVDFSAFGPTETKPLNKIKRLTGANVHRSWLTIPHVTQFDEADITDLEAFRKAESEQAKANGYKLTILAFVCKAVSKVLAMYPQFNASLDASGENLVYKQYCHIGIAAETPNGLVVPVIRDVDKLSIADIAREMGRLSAKARDKGLAPAEMRGGCFTISSLGGIGGTAFTPIVNSPEVAILGLSRSAIKPVFSGGNFVPRLMLPLSLSYDHRVIDGAEAARFSRTLAEVLADIRRILL